MSLKETVLFVRIRIRTTSGILQNTGIETRLHDPQRNLLIIVHILLWTKTPPNNQSNTPPETMARTCAGSLSSSDDHSNSLGRESGSCLTSSRGLEGSIGPSSSWRTSPLLDNAR